MHIWKNVNCQKFGETCIQSLFKWTKLNHLETVYSPETPPTIITVTLPYAGYKGEKIINKTRKHINKTIPTTNTTKIQIIYKTKKTWLTITIHNQRPDERNTNTTLTTTQNVLTRNATPTTFGQTKCRLLKRVKIIQIK